MDSGQLDFYQHSTLCTNTCRSTKFDLLINNTRFPPDGSGLSTPTSSQGEGHDSTLLIYEKCDVNHMYCVDFCDFDVAPPILCQILYNV